MVLIDTSVWLRGFAGREPYRSGLDALLARNGAAAHELVYGELLIGDRGGRTKFLADYRNYYLAETVPHGEVVEFARARNLNGRGAGWIDVHLLVSALAGRMTLWTADPRLEAIAGELGVAYRIKS